MTPSRGLEPGAHADVNGPASALTKTTKPFSLATKTRLKPTSGALVFGQIAVDHAGHHHQPLLSAVLQGGIVCDSDAAPHLGLSLGRKKVGGGSRRGLARARRSARLADCTLGCET
jgi:hypothetical protein